MGSPSPASPVTQTTQISQMDPRLYQWLYGTANSPGRLQIANASMLGKTMQGVQNADPTALAAWYNVPKGTDLAQFQSHTGAINPGQADPSLMQFPGKSVTPQDYYKQATAGEKEDKKSPTSTAIAAEGGELDAYAQGGRPKPKPKAEQLAQPTADLNEYGLTASQQRRWDNYEKMRNSGKKFTQQQIRDYNSMRDTRTQYQQANPKSSSGNTPLSLADAQIGVTPYFDPQKMQSTNPYYNQAIDVLRGMGTQPSQYGQATDLYGQVGKASWTDPGVAQRYMNPYIETALKSQEDLANRQFAQQQNQLRSQAAGRGAFGGSASALAEQASQQNQNLNMQNLVAQGMNQAYSQGMGQFGNEQQQRLGAAQGLGGMGNSIANYNQNLLQNWGAAGNTLQNLAQNYYNQRQQSAQNIWGGVNTATQPATGTLLGSPWGTSYQGQYQQRKKGGKLSIKV